MKRALPDKISLRPKHQVSQSLPLALLLALNGGYLEIYTYTTRDQVFANAQTGNIVLAALSAAQGDWKGFINHMIPVVTFAVGVLLVLRTKSRLKKHIRFHWRQLLVLCEMLILIAAAFIPSGPWNAAVTFMVAFVCALQYGGFKNSGAPRWRRPSVREICAVPPNSFICGEKAEILKSFIKASISWPSRHAFLSEQSWPRGLRPSFTSVRFSSPAAFWLRPFC